MIRRLFAVTIVIAVIGWIILSYLPGLHSMLPALSFDEAGFVHLFPTFILIGFGLFLLIQLRLLAVTPAIMRNARKLFEEDPKTGFQLRTSSEFFWTLLPLLMTLGLGAAVYRIFSLSFGT